MTSGDHTDLPAAVTMRGVTKRFGDVVACRDVDLTLRAGEVHGILGENGAGKSTLMRILAGLEQPDAGTVHIDGSVLPPGNAAAAARLGVGMVHQQYSLIDALMVWENVALAHPESVDRQVVRDALARLGDRFGLGINADALVRDLEPGMRQRVEIAKCLIGAPRVLILDEPTAALVPSDGAELLALLRRGVSAEGWAVALVSHDLDELLATCDRISVMRRGRIVESVPAEEATAGRLAEAMVGHGVGAHRGAGDRDGGPGRIRLSVEAAQVDGAPGVAALNDLTVQVAAGEIVGLAGVEGNGQATLTRVLSSLTALDGGRVLVDGQPVATGEPGAMLRAGVVTVPADRNEAGCVPDLTIAENLALPVIDEVARGRVLDREAMAARAAELISEFGIDAPGPDTVFADLSGGNQQRTLLAQAFGAAPQVLVAHEPGRGLDIAASAAIDRRFRSAAANGTAVLLISADLDELVDVADRVVVIARGRIVGELSGEEITAERLGLLLGGAGA